MYVRILPETVRVRIYLLLQAPDHWNGRPANKQEREARSMGQQTLTYMQDELPYFFLDDQVP